MIMSAVRFRERRVVQLLPLPLVILQGLTGLKLTKSETERELGEREAVGGREGKSRRQRK